MKTPSAAGLLLLAVVLAGCQTDGYAEHPRLASSMIAQVGHAKTAKWSKRVKRAATHRRALKAAKRVKPVKAAATNRAALGLKLVGEQLRMVVFQERLRGLCEVDKAEQVSADAWRASCTNGGAFVIKVYPDGFMTVTRS